MRSLINVIRENEDVADFLSGPSDFELCRSDHLQEVRLASGMEVEGFAGCASGGTYFFCGEGGEERPVLYADSEGGAALIAIGLPELLMLLLVVPWWDSCVAFTTEECRRLEEEVSEYTPDLHAARERAARALGLELPGETEVLARLREVALGAGEGFVLVTTEANYPHEPLITA